jgi:hypothetical protein
MTAASIMIARLTLDLLILRFHLKMQTYASHNGGHEYGAQWTLFALATSPSRHCHPLQYSPSTHDCALQHTKHYRTRIRCWLTVLSSILDTVPIGCHK